MINIYSKSPDKLGRDLTNPSYAKNGTSEFDITPTKKYRNPDSYILPNIKLFDWALRRFGIKATAKDAWGNSVEAWYFSNTKDEKGKDTKNQWQKEEIMLDLIICKFETYPYLIDQIDLRGGINWLTQCSHIVSGNKNWEGVGEKSNFIKVLCKAYRIVKGYEKQERQNFFSWYADETFK